ncbi:hypothetical protein Pmani_019912 [Petrolisthes manimaculis]|uniref:Uncharacterized protein n=1 Tax=Petrolisthes manimaculis TaxID=1843537 RepID=A0AAE1PJC3_9EUCA|nr:hypothetical protein Pmani_019912 [Petrolisthes manimaculis]
MTARYILISPALPCSDLTSGTTTGQGKTTAMVWVSAAAAEVNANCFTKITIQMILYFHFENFTAPQFTFALGFDRSEIERVKKLTIPS